MMGLLTSVLELEGDLTNIKLLFDILASIIGLAISVTSIIIAVKTLNANKRMIEESTRPNIVIYSKINDYSTPIYRIIIKNYGASAAKITRFSSCGNVDRFLGGPISRNPFNKLEGITMAPGQSFVVDLDPNKVKGNIIKEDGKFKFEIKYDSFSGEEYIGEFTDNIYNSKDLSVFRPKIECSNNGIDKGVKIIAHTLQQISDDNQ